MGTIGFIGDIHGSEAAFSYTLAQCFSRGCTAIIQTGDFAVYHPEVGPRDLDATIREVAKEYRVDPAEISYRFIDGNHEFFDRINPDAAGPVQLSEFIMFMPRGSSAVVEGRTVAFLGGASSTDRNRRVPGRNWWPAENITEEQVARVPRAEILVTHCPGEGDYRHLLACGSEHGRSKENDAPDIENRRLVDQAIAQSGCGLRVHGHIHAAGYAAGRVSLGMETEPGSVALVDTLYFHFIRPIGLTPDGRDDRFSLLYPPAVPASLNELRGPSTGTVTLPPHWGGGSYDLSDREQVRRLYRIVLTEARTAAELVEYVDKGLLVDAFWNLRVSPTIRREWEGLGDLRRRAFRRHLELRRATRDGTPP